MPSDLDWAQTATRFLERRDVSGPVVEIIRRLQHVDPLEITEAVGPETAEDAKDDATAFLLLAVRDAVSDHAVTDEEVRALTHVKRIFRIEEGDFLSLHEKEVADLLSEELERLLEDWEIDPAEAVHKVKLQDVLDLSYDEFINLTAPEIDKVVVDLLNYLTAGGRDSLSSDDIQLFRRRLMALDTVYDLNAPDSPRSPRSGYLYLLVNPSMPGLVKIGKTNRTPDQRASELASATGVPEPFILLYELLVQDADEAERWVHGRLEDWGKRHSENREFFAVAPTEAVELMQQAQDRFALT